MIRTARIPLALALLASLACRGHDEAARTLAGPPVAPARGAVAYLTSSHETPRAGDVITVTLYLRRAPDVAPTGSFTARIAWNAAGLEYLGPAGAAVPAVAVHARDGELTIAGASVEGFADDALFRARLAVRQPGAMRAMQLQLAELRTVAFDDVLPRAATRAGVFSLPAAGR